MTNKTTTPLCGCENSSCDNAMATAFEFLGAMAHRGMCEKQMYAVALAMVSISEDTIDAVVDAFARVDVFGDGRKPDSLVSMLTKFVESREHAEKQKTGVLDAMNEYFSGSEKAQEQASDFIESRRREVPGFEELTAKPAASDEDTLINAIKRAFPDAQVVSIDPARFGSKLN